MSEINSTNELMNKRFHCWGMCGGGSSRIFWGIFFIVIGLFWFGKRADWFPPEVITMFWPLVFVLAGIWFIVAALRNKGDHH
jgi:hypothetical protein